MSVSVPLSHPRLPKWAPYLVGAVGLAAAGLPALLAGWSPTKWLALAVALYLVLLPAWSLAVENGRAALDRLVTGLVWAAAGAATVPLAWLLFVVIGKGIASINGAFLTTTMYNVVGAEQGGLYHALIGTLFITLTAALISVPIGVLCAIYLVEYGARSRLARVITFLVDVMTGIPSIVAGLFALSLFVLIFGPAYRAGFGGSVALSLLMLPTVVRSSEEMFRLVPHDLREASYALGVPKWRTILRVVLPTSIGGVITGIVLAISRVVGETAPLLVVAGSVDGINYNLFNGRMTTIPVYIFEQYSQSTPTGYQNAWGGALVLLFVVVALNLTARIIGRILAPAKGH
ncbi:MAG: phosphate ABC transporter permease PstA [Nocardioides sp.]